MEHPKVAATSWLVRVSGPQLTARTVSNVVTDLLSSIFPKEAAGDSLEGLGDTQVASQRMIMHSLEYESLGIHRIWNHNAPILPPMSHNMRHVCASSKKKGSAAYASMVSSTKCAVDHRHHQVKLRCRIRRGCSKISKKLRNISSMIHSAFANRNCISS